MPISPSSTVHLCGVPLAENQKHQIRFEDSASQYAYFYSKKKKSITDGCKIVKGQNAVFQVPFNRDEIITCNYIMYRNTAYATKWFYAFITDIQYVADGASNITIKTDVYQTWMFDVTYKKSFIERSHINVGYDHMGNIPPVDEGLAVAEYVCSDKWNIDAGNNLSIIVASTAGPAGSSYAEAKYAGVVSGYTFFAFDNDSTGVSAMHTWIDSLNNDESIGFVFLVPKYAVPTYTNGDAIGSCDANIQTVSKPVEFSSIDGYTPKNAKLYMYPYNFLYATTNNGVYKIFRYENFSVIWADNTTTLNFTLAANLAIEPRVMVAPRAYRGQTPNYDESIVLDGFPMCSWRNDFYKSWLATNGLSQAIAAGTSLAGIIGGAVTANPLLIAGGVAGIAQSIGQFSVAAMHPDSAGGSNKGSINAAVGNLNITFYQKHIDGKTAEIIDDYFELYGYKLNELSYLPVHTRKYWNYIKTIDVNITGDIPPQDMIELKSIYDNGVTLWHYPEYFLDYTRNNHEVIA